MNSKNVKISNGSSAWRRILWRTSLCMTLAFLVQAQEPEKVAPEQAGDAGLPIDIYTYPKPIRRTMVPPAYPRSELRAEREAWVQIGLMVDVEGKPYELYVVDSIGNDAINEAALEAAKRWRFTPATLNGRPIESGLIVPLTFSVSGAGNSRQFSKIYRAVYEAIDSGNKELADQELPKLVPQTLSEDCNLSIIRYNYYSNWGTEAQQLEALKRVIGYEAAAISLPKGWFQEALFAMFSLQMKARDFSDALDTVEALRKNRADPALLKKLEPIIDELKKLQQDDRSYAVDAEIGARASWHYKLFKKSFHIDVQEGRVDEIKLRCKNKVCGLPVSGRHPISRGHAVWRLPYGSHRPSRNQVQAHAIQLAFARL